VGHRLDHPHLRKSLKIIRQGGLIGGGATQVMLLLELIDGVTLEARRPRSRRLKVEVFKSVAAGLGAMHDAGLVHADMKPINIMLMNSGGLKIIDFGQSCPINTIKTRIQGTLDYIAPEQVKRGPITPRTDVYNLGATMYWSVTDRHPPTALRFRGTPGQRVPKEVDKVLRDPREYNPHVPPALAGLILDCLHQQPEDRPASMKEVAFRLDLALHQIQNKPSPISASHALQTPPMPAVEVLQQSQPITPEPLFDPLAEPLDLDARAEPALAEAIEVMALEVIGVADDQEELDLPIP
jgi:serine/threonine-protein kinase